MIELIVVMVVLLAFIILILYGSSSISEINDEIQADDSFSNRSKDIIGGYEARQDNLMDGLFLFAFIILWVLVIVSSFLIDSHPVFFIITVVLLVFIFIIAGFLGNTYEEIATDSSISAEVADYPMANWIMSHFLILAICVGFSIVIALFAKNQWMT